MKKIIGGKTAYILLLIFVLSSALFLYFFALKVDKRYSDLIVAETQISNNLYKIANNHSRNMNVLSGALYTTDKDSIMKAQTDWEARNSGDSMHFRIVSDKLFLNGTSKDPILKLAGLQAQYTDMCKAFFTLRTKYPTDTARFFLRHQIHPVYYSLRDQLESLMDLNNKKLLELSDKMTSDHQKTGLIFLTVGASPFLFFVGYLVFSLLFLVYLAFQIFRTDQG